jgi:hypothetical protein
MSMPQVEFDPTIPMFERAKAVHGLDHAATMIVLDTELIILNEAVIYRRKQNGEYILW